MSGTLVLSEKEKQNLLSEIDNRDMYNAVLAFIDTIKHKDNYPYSIEEYRQIAGQAIQDRKAGINYTCMQGMRKLHPK